MHNHQPTGARDRLRPPPSTRTRKLCRRTEEDVCVTFNPLFFLYLNLERLWLNPGNCSFFSALKNPHRGENTSFFSLDGQSAAPSFFRSVCIFPKLFVLLLKSVNHSGKCVQMEEKRTLLSSQNLTRKETKRKKIHLYYNLVFWVTLYTDLGKIINISLRKKI